jgi:hypothetical protein
VAPDAAVVLAVPAWVAGDLVPGLTVPDDHRAIVNAHFAIAPPKGAPEMLGLINATSEWLFTHPDRVSVTISAADRLVDTPREEMARTIWAEVAQALGLPADTPCRHGRSSRKSAPPLPPPRRRSGCGPNSAPLSPTFFWPVTGSIPAFPPPSRAPCAAAIGGASGLGAATGLWARVMMTPKTIPMPIR